MDELLVYRLPEKVKDITGGRFGRLRAVTLSHRNGVPSAAMWWCHCDCGRYRAVAANSLKAGKTQSCGCKWQEGIRKSKNKTHGLSGTKLYVVWRGMLKRCHLPSDPHYPSYGARGIKVCPEWRADFAAFKDWAAHARYTEGLQIDRIDNNGNYTPDNCRWVTCKQNNRNRRSNMQITFRGKTMTATEWAEEFGLKPSTFTERLSRGWTVELASRPILTKHERLLPYQIGAGRRRWWTDNALGQPTEAIVRAGNARRGFKRKTTEEA